MLRLRPLTEGVYLADSYAYELVTALDGVVVHSWGEHKSAAFPISSQANFRICPSGPEVYADGWKKYTQVPRGSRKILNTAPESSSPDCAYTASFTENTVTIRSAHGGRERRWSAPAGTIQSLAWSPDSSRILLVLSHGADFFEKFESDEILLVQVAELPEE